MTPCAHCLFLSCSRMFVITALACCVLMMLLAWMSYVTEAQIATAWLPAFAAVATKCCAETAPVMHACLAAVNPAVAGDARSRRVGKPVSRARLNTSARRPSPWLRAQP